MKTKNNIKDFNFNINEKKTPFYIQFIWWLVYALLVVILISQVVFSITHFQAVVYGESMQNTLNSKGGNKHDKVFVDKYSSVEVGDIVVAEDPFGTQIIKRVIALEGDILRYEFIEEDQRCVLFINGEKQEENYIKREVVSNFNYLEKILPGGDHCVLENVVLNNNGTEQVEDDYFEYVVPKDCFFLMGDNRENSHDSRDYGAIKIEKVFGVVDYILPYGESEINFWFRRTFGF